MNLITLHHPARATHIHDPIDAAKLTLQAPVLKSSALAMLLVPDERLLAAVGNIDDYEEAERRSRMIKVRLMGGKLVLAD